MLFLDNLLVFDCFFVSKWGIRAEFLRLLLRSYFCIADSEYLLLLVWASFIIWLWTESKSGFWRTVNSSSTKAKPFSVNELSKVYSLLFLLRFIFFFFFLPLGYCYLSCGNLISSLLTSTKSIKGSFNCFSVSILSKCKAFRLCVFKGTVTVFITGWSLIFSLLSSAQKGV